METLLRHSCDRRHCSPGLLLLPFPLCHFDWGYSRVGQSVWRPALKTALALVELHKVRHGRYPASLRDIRFRGGWDQLALNSVDYYPNPEGTAYYLEVNQGWVAKPDLQMPPEFWQGTGYSPKLKPPPK